MNELLLFMKDKWGKSRSLKERQRDSNRIINHVYCILKVNDKQTHVSFCEIRCSTQCQSILLLLNVVKCIRCFSCEHQNVYCTRTARTAYRWSIRYIVTSFSPTTSSNIIIIVFIWSVLVFQLYLKTHLHTTQYTYYPICHIVWSSSSSMWCCFEN